MPLETAANIVWIILLKIFIEGNMQTAQLLDVHEDFLPEWMKAFMDKTMK